MQCFTGGSATQADIFRGPEVDNGSSTVVVHILSAAKTEKTVLHFEMTYFSLVHNRILQTGNRLSAYLAW